jgi:Phage integrase, N-terminal SAM-like domain
MQPVPPEVWASFERRLDEMRVPPPQRPDYRKWVRFYFDFCHKYGHCASAPTSRGPFLAKLASKNQSVAQRSQASAAVGLLFPCAPEAGAIRPSPPAAHAASPPPPVSSQPAVSRGCAERGSHPVARVPLVAPQTPRPAPQASAPSATQQESAQPTGIRQNGPAAPLSLSRPAAGQSARPSVPGRGASWEQEYRDLEAAVLLRNYSPRTLEAYRFWIARFQAFVRSRPTAELGTQEVRGFLSDLAVREHVAASTQNQAFNALLFFYRHVLRREFGQLDGVVRAKRHRYVPVVLSHAETEVVLGELQPPYRLVGLLLYGCGLRLMERFLNKCGSTSGWSRSVLATALAGTRSIPNRWRRPQVLAAAVPGSIKAPDAPGPWKLAIVAARGLLSGDSAGVLWYQGMSRVPPGLGRGGKGASGALLSIANAYSGHRGDRVPLVLRLSRR